MKELEGKRLLFLGGTKQTCDAVEIAKKLGVCTLVTDYYPDSSKSPARQMADQDFSVNIFDVNALTELCRREHVDGVMTVANEQVFPAYVKICEIMGYPCYLSEKSRQIFANKENFKTLLKKCGLPTIPQYEVSLPAKKEELDALHYPVIVKPSDSNASRGVSTCYGSNEMPAALEKAKDSSSQHHVLVERFMQCDDLIINYMFRDGDYRLCQMGDRFVNHSAEKAGSVTNLLVYPSVHMEEFLETAHPLLCDLFREAGVRDGVMFLQAFYENGKFFCYDPGYRTCGAQVYKMQEAACNVPQMEMLIRHALTGSMGPAEWMDRIDPAFHGRSGCNHAVLLKAGTVASVEGVEEVRAHPGVVNLTQFIEPGDTVGEQGTLKQTFARIHYLCDSPEELYETIRFVQDHLRVRSAEGDNLVIPDYDLDAMLSFVKNGREIRGQRHTV